LIRDAIRQVSAPGGGSEKKKREIDSLVGLFTRKIGRKGLQYALDPSRREKKEGGGFGERGELLSAGATRDLLVRRDLSGISTPENMQI